MGEVVLCGDEVLRWVLKAKVLAEPALVGREQELEQLHSLLTLSLEGKGNTVFISGEAGSGKTRLTNEFLNLARQKEVAVLSGWCLSDVAVPYFPFMEAFSTYYRARKTEEKEPESAESEGSEIKAWLMGPKPAKNGAKLQDLTPQAWQDLTFAAVTNTLQSISSKKPAIMFLDDVHWADSASLSLLHYISRSLRTSKVLILVTFRSEELNTDEEGHPHPLAETLRLMRREDLCTEIKLPNLSQTYVSKVAENMIGGTIHPELATKLAAESQGNPLFIVESLRMLSERGSLYQENDLWRLSVDALSIPDKLKDIILRRLSVLKFSQRRVVDAASVLGEKFDVELLRTVLGQDSLEVLETLNVVAQSTSLVQVEENFYRFDHAKSREAIYEEIPMPLKRGYHARVAEKLESRSNPLPFSDIAYHYAQAGNKTKAVEYALDAGEDALARFSNQEAIKHFTYVLQNLPDLPEKAEKKRTALEGLGDAYYVNGMFEKAVEVFERLAGSETGKVKLRAYRKAMDAVFFGSNDQALLIELANKAEPYSASDRLENARIRFHKAGNFTTSLLAIKHETEEFEAALQVFEEEYSLPDVARALEAVGFTASLSGENGLSKSLRSITMTQELNDLRGLVRANFFAGRTFQSFGLFQEAWSKYDAVIQIGDKIGAYDRVALSSLEWGRWLDISQRCFEEALYRTLKAVEYLNKTYIKPPKEMIYATLMRQYAKVGNMELAEEYHSKLEKLLEKTNLDTNLSSYSSRSDMLVLREVAKSQAVFYAAKGLWEEAKRYFEEAVKVSAGLFEETGWRTSEVGVKADYAWALDRQGKTEEAKVLHAEVQRFFDEVEKRFAHVNIDASLIAPWKVMAGEEFEMRLDLVNVSRKPGLLVKAECLVVPEFEVTSPPANYSLENGSVEMKNRSIGPFQVETIKLKIKVSKPGAFTLNPQVTYTDEPGETNTCKPTPITITVQPAQPKYEMLPGRISTGLEELDALLFGGIPQNYAVVLTSPSTDERQQLISCFLEAGITAGETTFYITSEAAATKVLAEKYSSCFFLFLCNPQADSMIENLPNVFKLKGVENLTDIDIALTKAFRTMNLSATGHRRICIGVVSDVLLQHHAVTTRRWLSALVPTLKSKGFTLLATVNPRMHPSEEYEAILGLFDGEISVYEKETSEGIRQVLRVRKLLNQKYLDKEIVLTKESLS